MYLRGEAFIIKETADALGDKGALSPDFLYVQRQGEAPNKADIVLIWVASLHHDKLTNSEVKKRPYFGVCQLFLYLSIS